jgi:hypothetical protein
MPISKSISILLIFSLAGGSVFFTDVAYSFGVMRYRLVDPSDGKNLNDGLPGMIVIGKKSQDFSEISDDYQL